MTSLRRTGVAAIFLAVAAVFAADILYNPFGLEPHRFTFGGRFADFREMTRVGQQAITARFFLDDAVSFDGDVRGVLESYARRTDARPLGRLGPDERPYYPHPGFQAYTLSLLARVAGLAPSEAYVAGTVVFAWLTALTLAALVAGVWREFGGVTALVTCGLLLLSDWLVFIGASVYWASFTMYLPLVAGWLFYPAIFTTRSRAVYAAALLGALAFLRCMLGGYEFITNIVLGFTVPVVYFLLKRGLPLWSVAKEVTVIAAGGALGVMLAFGCHCLTLSPELGSANAAAARILSRAKVRMLGTNAGPLDITQAEKIPAALQRAPRDLVKAGAYMVNSVVTFPLPLRAHVFLGTAAVIQALLFFVVTVARRGRGLWRDARLRGVNGALMWGFVCGCSWIVMMPGHMRPHVYFATIVFYVPWLLTLYVAAGAALPPCATAAVHGCWWRWQKWLNSTGRRKIPIEKPDLKTSLSLPATNADVARRGSGPPFTVHFRRYGPRPATTNPPE